MTALHVASYCIGATAVLYIVAAAAYALSGRGYMAAAFICYAAANLALLSEGMK